MDEEQQAILNQGLLDWQKKKTSSLGGKDLVAWMLNHAKIDSDDFSKKEELSVYIQKTRTLEETIGHVQSHSILLPLLSPGKSYPFQRGGVRGVGYRSYHKMRSLSQFPNIEATEKMTSDTFVVKSHSSLELDLVESSLSSTPEPRSPGAADHLESPLSVSTAPEPDCVTTPPAWQQRTSTSYSESHSQLNKRISKKKFIAILKKAPKEYNIDAIVADLQDPTGQFIELRDIGKYHEKCQTLCE